MISPGSIAKNGYLGNTLSVATDGYIAPETDLPFVGGFMRDFMTDFVGNFVSSFLAEADES